MTKRGQKRNLEQKEKPTFENAEKVRKVRKKTKRINWNNEKNILFFNLCEKQSISDAAKKFNISYAAAYQKYKKNQSSSINTKKHKRWNEREIEKICEMKKKGKTNKEIGDYFGVSEIAAQNQYLRFINHSSKNKKQNKIPFYFVFLLVFQIFITISILYFIYFY